MSGPCKHVPFCHHGEGPRGWVREGQDSEDALRIGYKGWLAEEDKLLVGKVLSPSRSHHFWLMLAGEQGKQRFKGFPVERGRAGLRRPAAA